jgi:hypothetical protein
MSDAIVRIQSTVDVDGRLARALTVLMAIADAIHDDTTTTDPDDAKCSGLVNFTGLGVIFVIKPQPFDKARDMRGLSAAHISHLGSRKWDYSQRGLRPKLPPTALAQIPNPVAAFSLNSCPMRM